MQKSNQILVDDVAALRRDRSLSRSRRCVFGILLLVVMLVMLEVACYLLIWLSNSKLQVTIRRTSDIYVDQTAQLRQLLDPRIPQLHELDPELGWLYSSNYSNAIHQLNSKGLRSSREYTRLPPKGVLRVAAFGDSFTYGSEVGNADAWPLLMETDGQSPPLEVLNYGVPGFGTDQAFLRYLRSGNDYSPNVIVIGFPPTDLTRNVNVYRRFFSHAEPPLFKPRFKLDNDGKLTLMKCPLQTRSDYERLLEKPTMVTLYGKDDQWFEPWVYYNPLYDYSAAVRLISSAIIRVQRRCDKDRPFIDGVFNTNSTPYKIQCLILEAFAQEVRCRGAKPIVVFLPGRVSPVPRQLQDLEAYLPIMEHLKVKGIDYADGGIAFEKINGKSIQKSWFAPGGHYSPEGNKIIAAWLATEMRVRYGCSTNGP